MAQRTFQSVPAALVTGGSRGLGRGICVRLAADGFSVAVGYARNADAAEQTIELCERSRRHGGQCFTAVRADIGSSDDRENLLDESFDRCGRVDALVNNAGVAPRERNDITEMSEQSFDEVLDTNLKGPFFLTQSLARRWLSGACRPVEGGSFKIVFVTSISAHTASVNRGEYCISKAGLSMARQLWAVRLAEQGIQVVEIRPGIMATDMTSGVKEKYDRLLAEGLVPQRRWGTPEDVGLAVSSVLAGRFPFSTGAVIDVDGGFHLRTL